MADNDITVDQGRAITAEAADWIGTPYALIGASSKKSVSGDCSGSTYKIYSAAGFSYDYRNTGTFAAYAAQTNVFRKLAADEDPQDGDVLLWPDHMAIYSTFYHDAANAATERANKSGTKWSQKNDMWTASHTGGPAYAPGSWRSFKGGAKPDIYRYQK